MRLGHGPRRTVVILWAWTALLSGVALVPDLHEGGQRARAVRRWPASRSLLFAVFHPGVRVAREQLGTGAPTPPAETTGDGGASTSIERRRQAGVSAVARRLARRN